MHFQKEGSKGLVSSESNGNSMGIITNDNNSGQQDKKPGGWEWLRAQDASGRGNPSQPPSHPPEK